VAAAIAAQKMRHTPCERRFAGSTNSTRNFSPYPPLQSEPVQSHLQPVLLLVYHICHEIKCNCRASARHTTERAGFKGQRRLRSCRAGDRQSRRLSTIVAGADCVRDPSIPTGFALPRRNMTVPVVGLPSASRGGVRVRWKLVGREGLEPSTKRLRVSCSTN
jgi:hypothetical protein